MEKSKVAEVKNAWALDGEETRLHETVEVTFIIHRTKTDGGIQIASLEGGVSQKPGPIGGSRDWEINPAPPNCLKWESTFTTGESV